MPGITGGSFKYLVLKDSQKVIASGTFNPVISHWNGEDAQEFEGKARR